MVRGVIVVGAGIEGSSAAYSLIKKGMRNVLLLEQVRQSRVQSGCSVFDSFPEMC